MDKRIHEPPATLIRGDTYYIAGSASSYGAYTFNTAVSGTTWVYIKKATSTDHGTETGWVSTYGTLQALFTTFSVGSTGYIDISGQYEYGIKADFGMGQHGITYNSSAPSMQFRYIDFDGMPAGTTSYSGSTGCLYVSGGLNPTGFLMSHCACHGGETMFQCEACNGVTIEYSDIYDNESTSSNYHANIMYLTGTNGLVFRYNKVHNMITEGIFLSGYGGTNSNIALYGNIFYDGYGTGRGIELRQDYSYSNVYIYNNTFVNLPGGGVNILGSCSGCVGRNNISLSAGFGWGDLPTATTPLSPRDSL